MKEGNENIKQFKVATKKVQALLLAGIMLCVFIVPAYAVTEIDYWYATVDNEDQFYRYGTMPSVWFNTYDGVFSQATFSSNVSHARTQWSNAGLRTTSTNSQTDASVQYYGGNFSTMVIIDDQIRPGIHVGRTSRPSVAWEDIYKVGNSRKEGYRVYLSKVVIIKYDGFGESTTYRNTILHEMGHVFGWVGHSADKNDVMQATSTTLQSLTNRDKIHVTQVYARKPY